MGPSLEWTLFRVTREDPERRCPFFTLLPIVASSDIVSHFDAPFKIALVVQARSIEMDSDPLRVELTWNGKWSDDTEEMLQNLVIRQC